MITRFFTLTLISSRDTVFEFVLYHHNRRTVGKGLKHVFANEWRKFFGHLCPEMFSPTIRQIITTKIRPPQNLAHGIRVYQCEKL